MGKVKHAGKKVKIQRKNNCNWQWGLQSDHHVMDRREGNACRDPNPKPMEEVQF